MPSHFSRPPSGSADDSSWAAGDHTDTPYPMVEYPAPPLGARASIDQATQMLMMHYGITQHDALRMLVHWSCLCDTNPIAIAENLTTAGAATSAAG